MADSVVYVRILMAGLVFTLIYNMCSGILRAIGDSKRPLYVLIACCVLNILLDGLFVAVLHMGVAGAAIATVRPALLIGDEVLRKGLATGE